MVASLERVRTNSSLRDDAAAIVDALGVVIVLLIGLLFESGGFRAKTRIVSYVFLFGTSCRRYEFKENPFFIEHIFCIVPT